MWVASGHSTHFLMVQSCTKNYIILPLWQAALVVDWHEVVNWDWGFSHSVPTTKQSGRTVDMPEQLLEGCPQSYRLVNIQYGAEVKPNFQVTVHAAPATPFPSNMYVPNNLLLDTSSLRAHLQTGQCYSCYLPVVSRVITLLLISCPFTPPFTCPTDRCKLSLRGEAAMIESEGMLSSRQTHRLVGVGAVAVNASTDLGRSTSVRRCPSLHGAE